MPRWRPVLAVLAALVVAGLGVGAILLAGGSGSGSASADPGSSSSTATSRSAPSSTPAPATAPVPAPTGATGVVDELPPSLPAVRLDEPAAVGNGIAASIASIEAIDGSGTGRGNVAGPALRVTVLLENGTSGPVSLDGVSVELFSGSDLTPASPLNDPSAAPFHGSVEARGHAKGVYVFSLAKDRRDSVTIAVGYQAGAPFMVFTGSAR